MTHRAQLPLLPLPLLPLLLLCACEGSPEAPDAPTPAARGRAHEHGHAHDHATVDRRFQDAERWAEEFEDPARDEWQRPEQVLAHLALAPDARVADIGAATGYFPVRFARAAPQGVVYGVDIEPTLVNYLNLRARREGLANLVALVCRPDDPCLPEPVDLVFVCDTYHHIDARERYFAALRERLRPGGRLAIVDFRRGDWPVGPPDPKKLPPERVIEELGRAGWELASQAELPYQYLLVFRPAPPR